MDREGGLERVLVLETLGAPPPPRRRRRRPRDAESSGSPAPLPLTRVTSVRAFAPFSSLDDARRWLDQSVATEEGIDLLVEEGIDLLNRALHVQAVASGDPHVQTLAASRAAGVRLGYGSGDEVAGGEFSAARNVDVDAGPISRQQQRAEELRPQERLAAVLGGREQIDACETLLLRARADLDAGREREATLQLRVGLEALLAELPDALVDPGHTEDMAALDARRREAGELANAALRGGLDEGQADSLLQLLELCERVLRRRRVLRG